MRKYWPYGLFVVLVAGFLWRPIFKGEALLPGAYLREMAPWNVLYQGESPSNLQWNALQWDAIAQFHPWRVFYARTLKSGVIPLWNPHQFCGSPFVANGQSAVFFPVNLYYIVADAITAGVLYACTCLLISLICTYGLCRTLHLSKTASVVAAIIYTFSAFNVLWLELPTFIGAAAMLPGALLFTELAARKGSSYLAMLAGAAVGMAFLAGHLQIAFYVGMAAALRWAWIYFSEARTSGRRATISKLGAPVLCFVAIAGLIAAAQVLPSRELAAQSHRASVPTHDGYARFVGNALPVHRAITAFVPNYFGTPADNSYYLGSPADYIEYGLYTGVFALILAVAGLFSLRDQKGAGFFAALALLALLVAAGSPLNYVFYYLIPGFSSLGGPNRVLVLYMISLALLAGFGVDWSSRNADKLTRLWRFSVPVSSLVGVCGALIIASAYRLSKISADPILSYVSGGLMPNGLEQPEVIFLAFLGLGVFVIVMSRARYSNPVFAAAAILMIAGDLATFGIDHNPTCRRGAVYPETELIRSIQQIAGNERVAPVNPRWNLYETPNVILPPNAATVYGFYDIQGYDSLFLQSYKEVLDFLQAQDSAPPENGNMLLIKAPRPELRWIAGIVIGPAAETDAYGFAVRTFEDIGGLDVFTIPHPPASHQKYIRSVHYDTPNRFSVNCAGAPDGLVRVCVTSCPGWKARIDGKEVAINPDDRLLHVRHPGARRIDFSYEPFSFKLGAFLLMAAVGTICFARSFYLEALRSRGL